MFSLDGRTSPSPGWEASLALQELRQTDNPWLGNQPTSLQESMQAEDRRIEERNNFLYCGTGLRNADNSSAPHMMCDGKIHHVVLPSSCPSPIPCIV